HVESGSFTPRVGADRSVHGVGRGGDRPLHAAASVIGLTRRLRPEAAAVVLRAAASFEMRSHSTAALRLVAREYWHGIVDRGSASLQPSAGVAELVGTDRRLG